MRIFTLYINVHQRASPAEDTKQPNEPDVVDSTCQPASLWLPLHLSIGFINEIDKMGEKAALHGSVLIKVDLTSAVEYLTFQ